MSPVVVEFSFAQNQQCFDVSAHYLCAPKVVGCFGWTGTEVSSHTCTGVNGKVS